MIKLGYALGAGPKPKYTIKDRIKILSLVEHYAIEISYIVADREQDILDDEDIQEIKKFKYISLHALARFKDYDNKECSGNSFADIFAGTGVI